jgi:adenylate kinase family enzyme
MAYKKILVKGGTGHGKTTVSNAISRKLNITNHELDELCWNTVTWEKKDYGERDKELKKILNKKSWIINGAFTGSWIEQAYKDADLILILKINSLIAQKRIILRHIKNKLKGKKDTLRETLKIIKDAGLYKNDYFIKDKELSKKFKKKHYILKNDSDVKRFIKSI